MFPKAIKSTFPRYYEPELEGKIYNNVELNVTILRNKIDGKQITKNDHFVIEDPSEKLLEACGKDVRAVSVNGRKCVLSEFTYEYYYGLQEVNYSTIVILFVEKDILGNKLVLARRSGVKGELFEICGGSNSDGKVRQFLSGFEDKLGIAHTQYGINKVGEFTRRFERKLIRSPVTIRTDIYVAVHEVILCTPIAWGGVASKCILFNHLMLYDPKSKESLGPITQKIIMDYCGHELTLSHIKLINGLITYWVLSDQEQSYLQF